MSELERLPEEVAKADGLSDEDRAKAQQLVRVWQVHKPGNDLRDAYYLGHVALEDIGVAIPKALAKRIDPRCDWPRMAVMALADRSRLNGFTCTDEAVQAEIDMVYRRNDMRETYRRSVVDELRHCCSAVSVSAGADAQGYAGKLPVIMSYPMTACGLTWDDSKKRVEAGLVVAKSELAPDGRTRRPVHLRMFTDEAVIEIRLKDGRWEAEYLKHSMGRPLIEPLCHEPSDLRPFGRSRITQAVMRTTQSAMRTMARAEIAAEFSALPQKWVVGTQSMTTGSDEKKYRAAMGVILEWTKDREGDHPTVGQFPQLSMQPHIDYMRSLAAIMANETNVPLSMLGVISDNPSSADAIRAATEPLIIDATNLNEQNGKSLRTIMLMALAVLHGKSSNYEKELDAGYWVEARFRNPAMPSTVSQSDAMVKQISAIPWLGETDVALEELGYSDDQMARMQAQKRRAQALANYTTRAEQRQAATSVAEVAATVE